MDFLDPNAGDCYQIYGPDAATQCAAINIFGLEKVCQMQSGDGPDECILKCMEDSGLDLGSPPPNDTIACAVLECSSKCPSFAANPEAFQCSASVKQYNCPSSLCDGGGAASKAPTPSPTPSPTYSPTTVPTSQPTYHPSNEGDTSHPTPEPTQQPTFKGSKDDIKVSPAASRAAPTLVLLVVAAAVTLGL